jgi:GNAT superfamily N-acetyltransferase
MIRIAAFVAADRERWETLARGYKTFYETPLADAEYETAWERLLAGDDIHGLGAHHEGELVGIAHYLFHTSIWATTACYLQDLFVDPAMRGKGIARALIEQVALEARARDAQRLYWTTKHDNATARALYDTLAVHKGFIRYDYPLE